MGSFTLHKNVAKTASVHEREGLRTFIVVLIATKDP
jgi:hypothetical protein